MDYGIWLSFNNQAEGFELPILPREIGPGIRGSGSEHDVYGLGRINVIKDRGLAEYTIESLFPSQVYPFITADIVLEPRAYVDYLLTWWDSKLPIRFVGKTSTMEVNIAASIESFEWKEVAGSPGDIQYALKLKEYRFYAARKMPVTSQDGVQQVQPSVPERLDERVPDRTHRLVSGETLWIVAKKKLGDGSRWREIQQLNNLSDSDLKVLPVGLTLQLPTNGGARYA